VIGQRLLRIYQPPKRVPDRRLLWRMAMQAKKDHTHLL
jgi:hypothetical protein